MVASLGAGARPNGMPLHSNFVPSHMNRMYLRSEPHVPAVGLADEEVHVEVAQVDLRDKVVAADELLNWVQPLHLEVLVPNATVGLAEIHTALHLVGALLWNWEEG